MNKAVFLDRDGTVNVDCGYVYRVEDLALIEGAAEALRMFQERGYLLILITNQSGVGRGYFTMDDVAVFNEALSVELARHGVKIDDCFICPHGPQDGCECRKPLPFMVLKAIEKYDISPSESFMFGDKASDVECGESAGVRSFRVTPEHSLLYWAERLLSDKQCEEYGTE